mmetsp:Transcript_73028/g.213963  ORF Transcript_73028/g.213963 Transcript_73028/m.213963 type:complete len:245 (+) Transcript_73028:44-778(+)
MPLSQSTLRTGRRGIVALRTAACCAVLGLALHCPWGQSPSSSTGFAVPRFGRRGLLGASLLGSASPVLAAEDKLVTLDIDVKDGDGSATEQVTLRLRPDWAPRGVRRFMKMISLGDLEDAAFYHVSESDGAHFGLPADPKLPMAPIKDDLARTSNVRGTLSFRPSSYSGRVNEVFINYRTNKALDRAGVTPIGEVVGDGMDVIDRLYSEYGDMPNKVDVAREGNDYLDKEFPKLAKIRSVQVNA